MEYVVKVYSGKNGKCMCGCAGTWSYSALGAIGHPPGDEVSVNQRNVTRIYNKVMKNPNRVVEGDHITFAVDGGRIYLVYTAED